MQTVNPFELILSRLDQLQSTMSVLSDRTMEAARPIADPDRLLDLVEAAKSCESLSEPFAIISITAIFRQLKSARAILLNFMRC